MPLAVSGDVKLTVEPEGMIANLCCKGGPRTE